MLRELRIVTDIIMRRDRCVCQSIKEYYGATLSDPSLTCNKFCLSCRNEVPKKIKRSILIDHLEADVFDEGSVTLDAFAVKLIAKTSYVWLANAMDVKPVDTHKLAILLWVHNIITIHRSTVAASKDDGRRTKKDMH